MNENEIAKAILDVAFTAHNRMGPGVYEIVYEVIIAHELRKSGFQVDRQVPIPIVYDELKFEEGFKLDLIVNDLVIVELKSLEALHPVHSKQVLTHLRLTGKRLGLLINFGEMYLKNGIRRIVNGLPEEDEGRL